MRDQVHVCTDADTLAVHARNWLVDRMGRHHADPEIKAPFSLALAGGSTPKRLYELLSELPAGTIDWNRVVLLWGDERNVPPDHADSNYRMVKESLLDRIAIPPENVLAVPEPGGNPQAAAEVYERLLREKIQPRHRKLPRLDCVLLGLGNDVHTASLFPGTQAIEEKSRLVLANEVPKLKTTRITFTAPLINAARNVVFLLSGSGKSEALSILWHAPLSPDQFPAQLIHPVEGTLTFLVDKDVMGDIPLPETVMVQLI